MPSHDAPRVLIVDDQAEMAEIIAGELSGRGYAAVASTSGRQALERLQTERFDALVTDVTMPEVDGLELLRASLTLDPSRPVILMTAFSTLETAINATGDGAYHYLTKPFRLDALVRLLRKALS
jgi:two-component system response regulator HydG